MKSPFPDRRETQDVRDFRRGELRFPQRAVLTPAEFVQQLR